MYGRYSRTSHIRPPRDRAIVRTLTHIPWGCLIQNHFFHKGLLRTLVNIVSLLFKIHKSTLPKDTTNHTVLWHRIQWNKSAPIRKYLHPYKMISCAHYKEGSYRIILLILWPATLSTLQCTLCSSKLICNTPWNSTERLRSYKDSTA